MDSPNSRKYNRLSKHKRFTTSKQGLVDDLNLTTFFTINMTEGVVFKGKKRYRRVKSPKDSNV